MSDNINTTTLPEEEIFCGRNRELAKLKEMYASDKFEFATFYDRRRIGKTALITAFAKVQESNLSMKNFVLEKVVSRFDDVMWVLQQIVFMSFDKRLAIFLWDEVCRNASTSLFLTHEEIAHHTGTAREVVSRMLKYFSDEKIVQLSHKKIEVCDKNKLRLLAM